MKFLLVHNFYGSSAPSGENVSFESEKVLLQKNGHEVELFTRHSNEIRNKGFLGEVQGAFATPWNPRMSSAIQKKIADFRPDVMHAHNTFPLISPAIFHAIGKKAARVLTLHNYRLFCPAAIPLRNGMICTLCIENKTVWPSLKYGCYRKSRLATLPLAVSVALHRMLGTWTKHVDAFITLSDFQCMLMARAGLPDERIYVKPNFYPGNPSVVPWAKRGEYVVFVGRLSVEKGVNSLLRAWRLWAANSPALKLVGAGEMRTELEKMASGLPVQFIGQVESSEAQAHIANARLLVLPSECFEGFPMVIREAFAFGTPVAVSNIGPLPSIVQHGKNGVVFEPEDPQSLLNTVRTAWESPNFLEKLGAGARAEFESKYTEDVNYKILMDIYEKAIREKKKS
jgi:glycosyltransferase involved in cell wall biosynthesis